MQSFFAALKALSRKEVHYGAYATSEQVINQTFSPLYFFFLWVSVNLQKQCNLWSQKTFPIDQEVRQFTPRKHYKGGLFVYKV